MLQTLFRVYYEKFGRCGEGSYEALRAPNLSVADESKIFE